MSRVIDPSQCLACGACIEECPVEAISEGSVYFIDADACIDCGACEATCPNEAIFDENEQETLPEAPVSNFSKEEQEYLDIYKEMLEDYDGEIGPRERKQLDRERTTLGISEERVKELEESLTKKDLVLTDKEQEYLELYKEMLEDYEGEIGPRERKQLDRNRARLGISESRATEIEVSLKGDNNKDFAAEQEYLDLVRELLADYGSIGAPQRKQLERTRVRLEISEQRAKEIESLIE